MSIEEGLRRRMKELRQDKGMTQDQLAKALHTTRQRYARMENGQADISFQDIRIMAEIFERPVSELMREDEENRSQAIFRDNKTLSVSADAQRLIQMMEVLSDQVRIYEQKHPKHQKKKEMILSAKRQGKESEQSFVKVLESEGIEVFRWPISEIEILGWCFYDGNRYQVVTNSALPFFREKETAYFLLALIRQNSLSSSELFVLDQIKYEQMKNQDTLLCQVQESMMVSEWELMRFVRQELHVENREIRAVHILQIQNYFQITAGQAEHFLLKYHMITEEQIKKIKKGWRYYGEERLSRLLGFDLQSLYKSWNMAYIPHYYIECLLYNFEQSYIPFVVMQQVFEHLGISAKELAFLRKPQDDRDDWDDPNAHLEN